MLCLFFAWYGDHRRLTLPLRRQRQVGIRDSFGDRAGHGNGVGAPEHPDLVEGHELPLVAGHAFSIEPGIYVPGSWGARLEDIVVATTNGPDAMNRIDHGLAVVDG